MHTGQVQERWLPQHSCQLLIEPGLYGASAGRCAHAGVWDPTIGCCTARMTCGHAAIMRGGLPTLVCGAIIHTSSNSLPS